MSGTRAAKEVSHAMLKFRHRLSIKQYFRCRSAAVILALVISGAAVYAIYEAAFIEASLQVWRLALIPAFTALLIFIPIFICFVRRKRILANVLENIADAILIVDAAWHVAYLNKHAANVLQTDIASLPGRDFREKFPELADTRFFHTLIQAMDRRSPSNLTADLFGAWFDIRMIPYGDGVLIELHDITKHKQVEQALLETNQMLQAMSELDSLTQIANRRRFDRELTKEWKRAARRSSPLSLIMLDIDFFKKYNDTYGHLAGDRCLQTVADILRENLHRPGDFAARYGGEEFAVLLPETDLEGAMKVADLLRRKVSEARLVHDGSRVSSYVTISLGAASVVPKPDDDPRTLVEMADRALYQAKQSRNRAEPFMGEGI
jgi:diguanylate cyclase (GGDEF)-like protein